MKRKAIILLSSILAGSLLVGGAFAAWAVTDNADPFGVNVTPGTLNHDNLDYVTMSWGDSTHLSNVENIKPGEFRKVGVVSLKTDEITYERGIFSVELIDEGNKTESEPNLINYLDVYLYQSDVDLVHEDPLDEDSPMVVPTSAVKVAERAYDATGDKIMEHTVTGSKSGTKYTVIVRLNGASASPTIYGAINEDIVFLRVDWRPNGSDVVTSRTVYFNNTEGWTDLKAYAWKDNGEINHDWPGVDMVAVHSGIFSVELGNDLTSVVFSGVKDDERHQTGDISLKTGYAAATPVCTYDFSEEETSWGAIPQPATYYLVGIIGGVEKWGVTDYAFVQSVDGEEHPIVGEYVYKNMTLAKGDELKAHDSNGTWYPGGDAGNYVINEAGTYDVYFRPGGNSDWGYYYLYFAKVS